MIIMEIIGALGLIFIMGFLTKMCITKYTPSLPFKKDIDKELENSIEPLSYTIKQLDDNVTFNTSTGELIIPGVTAFVYPKEYHFDNIETKEDKVKKEDEEHKEIQIYSTPLILPAHEFIKNTLDNIYSKNNKHLSNNEVSKLIYIEPIKEDITIENSSILEDSSNIKEDTKVIVESSILSSPILDPSTPIIFTIEDSSIDEENKKDEHIDKDDIITIELDEYKEPTKPKEKKKVKKHINKLPYIEPSKPKKVIDFSNKNKEQLYKELGNI